MTKRQLVCFSLAAAVGVPTYIFSRGAIGNEGAVLLMIGVMLPFFFTAMYEKDGQSAEKILRNIIRARMFFPGKRPYKTENMYSVIEKEGKSFAIENKTAGAAGKTPKRRRAKSKKRKIRA
jgi:preprotein translocase subunit SecY